jgi:hypothetical protein
MNSNQEPWRDAQDSNRDDPSLPSNQDFDISLSEAEQARRDLFHEAVQQALARRVKDSQRKGRDVQLHCAEILTSCELKFLLKQEV